MKKLIIATAITLGMGLTSAAFAQPDTVDREARAQARSERHVERLATELALTDAQKLEVQAIFAEQGTAQREMHERYRAERKALREQADARLGEVLSTEQREKLDTIRAERKENWRGKRHGDRHHRHDRAG
jgi:protein CpxP